MEAITQSLMDLHGRMSRAFDNFKKVGATGMTLGVAEARLEALEANWAKFESLHDKLVATHWEAWQTHEYRKQDLPGLAEEAYVLQKGAFLDFLRQLPKAKPAGETADASPVGKGPRTTLPSIKLPSFSGRYEDWPPFRDLLNSLIGRDASLSNVEKLHYLKASLEGEAELLVRDLPVTAENFNRAWINLTECYENKRLLVASYLSSFREVRRLEQESAEELKQLYHRVLSTVGAMAGIGRPLSSNEDLFVFLVVDLFDPQSRREWETSLSQSTDPPSFARVKQFLEQRVTTLDAMRAIKPTSLTPRPEAPGARRTRALHARTQEERREFCALCHQAHFILYCDNYRRLSADEKKRCVLENDLCPNCLGRHRLGDCKSSRTCFSCNSRHHSSLHDAFPSHEVSKSAHIAHHAATPRSPSAPERVLLATARVHVADSRGEFQVVRALLDQGSEASLLADSLLQRLHLPPSPTSVSVFGIGGKLSHVARRQVTLALSPRSGGPRFATVAVVLPRLTLYTGGVRVTRQPWPHLTGLELADPEFLATDPIELILGADFYASVLLPGLRKGGPQEPIAQETQLGWILSGAVSGAPSRSRVEALHCRVDTDLTDLVRRFWTQEEFPVAPAALTADERECEAHFTQTHQRDAAGRYVVRLPVASPLPDFSGSRHRAVLALQRMERRFERDDRLRRLYSEFMREYEALGHMSPTSATSASLDTPCFLPHHGVLREASATTKLRVVFNGSSEVATGESLNRHLLVGPNLLLPLGDVLLRWRLHRYVLAADVEKMYRQISVHPADHHLQTIVWRQDRQAELTDYRLTTVTYGLSCAPFLAQRTLRQLAEDEATSYPQGARALGQDVYMDDILTGAPSLAEAMALRQQLTSLCMAGGFPLRKWSANQEELLADIPPADRLQCGNRSWQDLESHSTLGLQWCPSTDHFAFPMRLVPLRSFTKRTVLSLTAKLFDPLGWLAPVVVRAKIYFQATWLLGLDWDTPLPAENEVQWALFQEELPALEEIRVPRRLSLGEPSAEEELHGFADASERAYAAALYLRAKDDSGRTQVRLISARTKVAPLQQVTLPRLELSAAALLVRLTAHVRRLLTLTSAPIHLWSDSTVALAWIQGHPTRWKTYVANRVAEIQTTLPEVQWHHLPGPDNPADCASRGLAPSELANHPLWWQGPPWLGDDPSEWPAQSSLPPPDTLLGECRRVHAAVLQATPPLEPEELTRFSSLNRLLRVTAWCQRWLASLPSRQAQQGQPPACVRSPLRVSELQAARWTWVKIVQESHFPAEMAALRRHQPLPSKSSLKTLNPFFDSAGVLRVGGRLKHSLLGYEEKHPAILPPTSHLTRLIVDAGHRGVLHGGVQLTLGTLRQQYWIPRGRAVVKAALHRCLICIRWRAATPTQLMADLPRGRVVPDRPFRQVGVDYAGPVQLRTTKGRGHRSYKAFIAVFVCLSTKATHLEVVSDYTTEAFLAAFRRFVSRRGLCSDLYSDCGSNFVGADAQLRAFFASRSSERRALTERLAADGIHWHFNPPAAPHFGGLWEAAVKSMKHHLRRVIGDATLTFEEMSTFLAQVEACLNSRPLGALSDDPEDLAALTPGHFLIGTALNAIPEPSCVDMPSNRLTRWQLLQKMRDHFWNRWSSEYVHSLQQRPKWWTVSSPVAVGRLCLLRNEGTAPTRWPLGRITAVHPGEDGHVRVVTIKTATTELKRPIAKLVFFPASDNDAGDSRGPASLSGR